MIEEINQNFYRIEIPLPGSPLKSLNSYVIKSQDCNIIIDTGWDRQECKQIMEISLLKLAINIRKTNFFITHLHSDHFSLVSSLVTDNSKIYFNKHDAQQFLSHFRWEKIINFAILNGYPEDEIQRICEDHPRFKYRVKENIEYFNLEEGDEIHIGEYKFKCIETPGHTQGHLCLYEPFKKIFLSGDHILNDITPNVTLWSDEWNPLKEYFLSLDKVFKLDILYIFPGHGPIIKNYRERIEELKIHHLRRLDEIKFILGRECGNAFQIASKLKWDINYDSWDCFPPIQKWFATGETIAHLKYLEENKEIFREIRKDGIVYIL